MTLQKLAPTVVFLVLAAQAGASSLTIHPTFDSTITGDSNALAIEGVINGVIQTYEADFLDPITVNITFSEMSTGLGQSNTSFNTILYSIFLADLTADAKTASDTTALAHLPTAGAYLTFFGTSTINVKTANEKAIGIASGANPDGTVSLNTHLTDVGSSDTTGQYSLAAVTAHEIDEVLGLGSGLDPPAFGPFSEDLYRYTSTPGLRSFTTNTSASAFFSIDGTNALAQFNNTGSGDFGDWQSSGSPKVQDAFATPFANPQLGVELTALDVIGFDLTSPAPEAATWVLMGSALLALAGIARRRAARRRR